MIKLSYEQQIAFNSLSIIVGNALYALTVVLFLVPSGLITGGATGIALGINRALGLPVSGVLFVINMTMLTVGWVLLGRLLRAMAAVTELRLVSAEGGSKDNAIPTAATAVITVADGGAARKAAETLAAEMKKEYRIADPGLTVAVETVETKILPMDEVTTGKALCMLPCLPNGVQAMSMDIPGLVQTSLNIGILKCGDDEMTAVCSVRSSVASQKQMVRDRLRCLTEQIGGHVAIWGDYPAWEYLPQSPLRERMTQVYREQYGREPVIETIHAGVECGIFSEKLPGLDCVSIGPQMHDIHTSREKLDITSTERTWNFLLEVLKNL